MAKEKFLINPIKKRKKAKAKAKKKTGGTTMAKKRAKKRVVKRRKTTVRRKTRRSAPKRRRVVARKRKRVTRRRRRNPVLASVGNPPKRRRKRRKSTAKRRKTTVRRRKRYNRNPPLMKRVKSMLPYMLTGGLGVAAVKVIPKFIPVQNPFLKMGIQLGIAIAGGAALGKFMKNKQHGTAFAIGGGAVVAYDLIDQFILSKMGLSEYQLDAYPVDLAQTEYAVGNYGAQDADYAMDDGYAADMDDMDSDVFEADELLEDYELDAFPNY